MDKGKVPEIVHQYISELENSDGLVLTFQIYKNLNSNKVVLTWKPAKEVDGYSQPTLRPYWKPNKSAGQLKRDQRRRAQYMEQRVNRTNQCEGASSGITSQLSHLDKSALELNDNPSMRHKHQSHSSTEFQRQNDTPLIPHTPDVFTTPQNSHVNSEEGAVGGVPDVQTINIPNNKHSKSKKRTYSLVSEKTSKWSKSVERKDSLRSSMKRTACKIHFGGRKVPSKSSLRGTCLKKYYEDSSTVDLSICLKCLLDD